MNTHTSLVVPCITLTNYRLSRFKSIIELFFCYITSFMTTYVQLRLDYIIKLLCGNLYLLDVLPNIMLLCDVQMCWFFISYSSLVLVGFDDLVYPYESMTSHSI